MSEFKNNLQKDDRVIHAETKRLGTVRYTPHAGERMVGIVWQGTKFPRYCDVMTLRLVLNGHAEEVAPVEGTPPDLGATAARPPEEEADPALAAIKRQHAAIDARMAAMNLEYRKLAADKDRLERAIAILSPA